MRRKVKISAKPKQLPVIKIYDQFSQVLSKPSLHTKLSFNNEIFQYIKKMKYTASLSKTAYLTANQTYVADSIFVIKKNLMNFVWFHQTYDQESTYDAYINPKINQYLGTKQQFTERCVSFPYIQFKVERSPQIIAEYVSQNRQTKIQNMFGYKAVIYQHCMDHLIGKRSIDWDVSRGNFSPYLQIKDQIPKTTFVLNEYSYRIKQALSKRKQNQPLKLTIQEENMKDTYQKRLKQQLQKQIMALYKKFNLQQK